MKQKIAIFLISVFACTIWKSYGANILVYAPSPGRSHFKPFQPLFIELANRGHNVTVLSSFPPNENIENYTHLQVSNVAPMSNTGYAYLRQQSRLKNYVYLYDLVQDVARRHMNDPNTRFLFQSESKFDVVIMELYHFDTYFALAGHFKAPIIGLCFQSIMPIYNWILKNPMQFSYIPQLYLPFSDDMDFTQRTLNALFGVFSIVFYHIVSVPAYQNQINALMKSVHVDESLNIEQITANLSLILAESHFSVDYPRPNLPNVIDVAGIHIAPPQPLPQDVKDFIDGAENGIIYVSMGTLINPDSMTSFGEKLISILEKLSVYRVVWKWDPDLVKNPPNSILIRKWLPQSDILRHPKTKLFISHGGQHGVMESVNGGVPILCFPFFTDQYHNAAIVEKYKFGIKEELEASEHDILEKIQLLLSDKKYADNAKKQSNIFKDRPMNPLDQAVYWTEYVIRHKGAPHLKSAATQLNWYQYLLLDVIAFLVFIVASIIYVIKLSLTILWKLFFGKTSNKIKKS